MFPSFVGTAAAENSNDAGAFTATPEAIIAFLASTDFEDAIRNAISLGGDADTLACITGGMAEAYHGEVPTTIAREAMARLDPRLAAVVERFRLRFARTPL